MIDLGRPAWMDDAACRGVASTSIFYPGVADVAGYGRGIPAEPASYCMRCPVRADCLEYAMATHEPAGIWGGLNPKDRDRWRRLRELDPKAEMPPIVVARKGRTPAAEPDVVVKLQRRPAGRPRGVRRAACGTDSGYRRHLRSGEQACPSCRDAHRRSEAGRRRGA